MKTYPWLSRLSTPQRFWLFGTIALMLVIIAGGIMMNPPAKPASSGQFNLDMSIRDIAPKLKVTGKALARELRLPLNVSKTTPLKALNVRPRTLEHATYHLLSHGDTTLKYYLFAALVLGGLVFLTRLGRPAGADIASRQEWYPRAPYIVSLLAAVVVAGFMLGKSPNPMEGVVKVFKSMVGLYPDPAIKVLALLFFIALAVVGNKLICGWACPFGALQELIYSLPVLKKLKRHKLPFILTNTVRVLLLAAMLLFLFGVIGGHRGTVIYHYINPFNLFNLDFETVSIGLTIVVALAGSFFFYRPFCHFICPFGLVSWLAERFSLFKVRIDQSQCVDCGACVKACPTQAAQDRVQDKKFGADCFSCARCLNVCAVDAIKYRSVH